MAYKIVSAVVPYDERIDTTSRGAELLTQKVNAEISKGWHVYGSLVVAPNLKAISSNPYDDGKAHYNMNGIGFFQVMIK